MLCMFYGFPPLSPHPFVLSILKISGQRLGGICES